ncbi:unnamed protein product, partial [Ectocarpus sp. 13 AM-2016]
IASLGLEERPKEMGGERREGLSFAGMVTWSLMPVGYKVAETVARTTVVSEQPSTRKSQPAFERACQKAVKPSSGDSGRDGAPRMR